MTPQGTQALSSIFIAGALLCVTCGAVAQDDSYDPSVEPALAAEPAPAPAVQELPLPERSAPVAEPEPALQELPLPPDPAPLDVTARAGNSGEPLPGIGNAEVLEMTTAGFAESTILAAISANSTRFDVAPRALVALKSGGVSERVIEAMLAAETANKHAAAAAETPAANPETAPAPTPEAFAKLTQMIEQLATEQEAAAAAAEKPHDRPPPAVAPVAPAVADAAPHARLAIGDDRVEIAPTIAQVAFTDERGFGNRTLKTLQSLAGKALAFADPAYGIASTLGGLLRPGDDESTAVWALAGAAASRKLDPNAAFEIEFANIPGVDPDRYQPAIVRLVPTTDNYRLVAAAKTTGKNAAALPEGPIVEETIDTKLTRLGRGRYRAAASTTLAEGQYALVLRPIARNERGRRKDSTTSLGELLGSGTSQILYLTWDFSVAADRTAQVRDSEPTG